MDSTEAPYSFPAIFGLRGDKYILEMSLQGNALKLSMQLYWHYSKAELMDEDNDDKDREPAVLPKPLRVQLCSISSPVLMRNEYVLNYADVEVSGFGTCDVPSSRELMTKALVEGIVCMVSVAELTQDESDALRLKGTCC